MNVTRGVFAAVMMAKEAVDDPNPDPMRINSALDHLDFVAGMARAAECQAAIDDIRENRS